MLRSPVSFASFLWLAMEVPLDRVAVTKVIDSVYHAGGSSWGRRSHDFGFRSHNGSVGYDRVVITRLVAVAAGHTLNAFARAPGADRAQLSFQADSSSDFRAISTLSF
jgi:hypothetical protein